MYKKEEILQPLKNIFGGVSLPHNKGTAEMQSVIMPAPTKVAIAMQQHIGAQCTPCVNKGDKVYVGTKIADSEKFVSAPIHSSVSGIVSGFGTCLLPTGKTCETVIIESDGNMTPDPNLQPVEIKNAEDLVNAAKNSGLVGLGGAGFPSHVKLKIDGNNPPDTLIVNCAECEPYITSDYRECIENTENILEGVYLLKEMLGFKQVIICVESNKPKAIEALYRVASSSKDIDNSVKLMRLKTRYPQGAEKMLIYTATGRKLPLGKLPIDVGCVVMNITSISVLNKYIKTGMPLVSKIITVDGNAVNKPQNVCVPIGTSIEDVINFCGGYKRSAKKILYGGPMMGISVADTSSTILKQNNALLVFDRKQAEKKQETPCIRCGRCAAVCPVRIQPLEIEPAFRVGDLDRVKALHVDYCIECGCCSYICPAKRYLTQVMSMAKNELKNRKQGE